MNLDDYASIDLAAQIIALHARIALKRYPQDAKTIDGFIARGITLEQVAGALRNKYGICVKSLYLVNYAKVQIWRRELEGKEMSATNLLLRSLDVTWACPNCSAGQLRNYALTARPICSNCGNQFEWENLLTQAQRDTLNPLLIEYEKIKKENAQ